jgi:hypothetical protein
MAPYDVANEKHHGKPQGDYQFDAKVHTWKITTFDLWAKDHF